MRNRCRRPAADLRQGRTKPNSCDSCPAFAFWDAGEGHEAAMPDAKPATSMRGIVLATGRHPGPVRCLRDRPAVSPGPSGPRSGSSCVLHRRGLSVTEKARRPLSMVAGCRSLDELITFAQQLVENLAHRVLDFGLRAESAYHAPRKQSELDQSRNVADVQWPVHLVSPHAVRTEAPFVDRHRGSGCCRVSVPCGLRA